MDELQLQLAMVRERFEKLRRATPQNLWSCYFDLLQEQMVLLALLVRAAQDGNDRLRE